MLKLYKRGVISRKSFAATPFRSHTHSELLVSVKGFHVRKFSSEKPPHAWASIASRLAQTTSEQPTNEKSSVNPVNASKAASPTGFSWASIASKQFTKAGPVVENKTNESTRPTNSIASDSFMSKLSNSASIYNSYSDSDGQGKQKQWKKADFRNPSISKGDGGTNPTKLTFSDILAQVSNKSRPPEQRLEPKPAPSPTPTVNPSEDNAPPKKFTAPPGWASNATSNSFAGIAKNAFQRPQTSSSDRESKPWSRGSSEGRDRQQGSTWGGNSSSSSRIRNIADNYASSASPSSDRFRRQPGRSVLDEDDVDDLGSDDPVENLLREGKEEGIHMHARNKEKLRYKRAKFLQSTSPEAMETNVALIESDRLARAADRGEGVGIEKIMDLDQLRKMLKESMSGAGGKQNMNEASADLEDQTVNKKKKKKKPKGTIVNEISIPAKGLTAKELASKLSMKTSAVILRLRDIGENIRPSEVESRYVDPDVVELLAMDLEIKVIRESKIGDEGVQEHLSLSTTPSSKAKAAGIELSRRPPVICVMGHVDHGKTTLLDALRKASVAKSESGGITQKLSAFNVEIDGQRVVFLDSPGHAAFSAMRSFGCAATDLVVLVVALDDGVRPQTIEAVKAAQKANCPIVIALNKVDKLQKDEQEAARLRVLTQLTEHDLIAEEFGGEVQAVMVSGKSEIGLDDLIERLLLQAELMDITASSTGQSEGTVLEAKIDKGRGIIADMLVRWGRLNVGDHVVVGTAYGRVKAMYNDQGALITEAGPSTPIRLLGLRDVPVAGDELLSVDSEDKARQIAERRKRVAEAKSLRQAAIDKAAQAAADAEKEKQELEDKNREADALESERKRKNFSTDGMEIDYGESEGDSAARAKKGLDGGEVTEGDDGLKTVVHRTAETVVINVMLKADGVGTLLALEQIVAALGSRAREVTVRVVGSSVGNITESDVDLANTVGNVLILGFNVDFANGSVRSLANESDIKAVRETVIYRLEDALRDDMETHMPKERHLIQEGSAKVQKVFVLNNKAKTTIAGLIVKSGALKSGSGYIYKVLRQPEDNGDLKRDDNDNLVAVGDNLAVSEIKRFKETVHEVSQGNECGLTLEKFQGYREEDVIECYRVEWVKKALVIEKGDSGAVTGTSRTLAASYSSNSHSHTSPVRSSAAAGAGMKKRKSKSYASAR